MSGIRGASRRAITLSDPLVVAKPMFDGESRPPLVFSPTREGVDLAEWATEHLSEILQQLQVYGALLFRGFRIESAGQFERAAGSLAPDGLFGDYGDLPRQSASEKIFHSTPYPEDLAIHFHNESSHMSSWPLHIFFYCAIAAQERGETPVLDCRALCRELDVDVLEEFSQKGLTYVRNFSEGIDVPWQSFFGTEDRATVEAQCREAGTGCEWLDENRLRISQDAAAVRIHPISGEPVFFNQVLLHHPAALPAATRTALLELYAEDCLPRLVTFGDGTPIPDDVVNYLESCFEARALRFKWQPNDILMLDNMLVSHGRDPFVGPRKILVAMSDMVDGS
jgi:alpha-ketoglutarate-dependent taurine dioxygenase